MKKFIVKALYFIGMTIIIAACSTPKASTHNSSPHTAQSKDLYDTIAHYDAVFFNAFNTRNLDKLKSLLSEDLEFYHDLGGVTNYNQNMDAFKRTFDSERRLRRELVVNTLEVYPINNYGAVETGIHRFYATEKGMPEQLSSEAKFVQVWQKTEGEWKITRIISYGHQEYLK